MQPDCDGYKSRKHNRKSLCMFIFDAHLDMAWNALEWNRDLMLPAQKIREFEQHFDEIENPATPAHTFVVLEVEPFTDDEQRLQQPPFDAPELKYRFGREIERRTGCDIFGYRL